MSVIDYVGFQQTGNTEQVTWKIPIQRKANPFPFQLFFSLLLTVKSNVSETLFLFILLFLPLLPIVVTGTTPWKTNLKVFVPHIEYSIYWKSPPLIVPHPGVFQGGSWNDPYKKGKNNIRSSTATAKAHLKRHCQRHSGPKGWVLVSKETSCERILIKFHLHNLDQASNFKTWPNVASESRPRIIFITSTKDQQQNIDWTSASNLVLNVWTKKLALWPNFSFQICTKLSSTRFSEST